MKLIKELQELRAEFGVTKEIWCSSGETAAYRELLKEGKPLPDGILRRCPEGPIEEEYFYKIEETKLTKEEIAEYIQYKQLKSLSTIKNCVVFFTVLTAISLVGCLIMLLSMFG